MDNNSPYGATDPAAAQDGERGLMGALAGGAAGRFGGKKAGHGLIGTLAGAFIGSKLEDKLKYGKKNDQHSQSGYSSHGSSSYGQGGYGQQGYGRGSSHTYYSGNGKY